jgi:hypothetical protein
MPIQVICPGCHKRFAVSDKFAGQKGPCPHCKTVIQIPEKSEEVVVHAPDDFGPKDAKGTGVLKPIARKEAKFSTTTAILIGVAVITVVVLAFVLRSTKGPTLYWILGSGAVLLGPPLALAGYLFLRNDELEPHRGRSLLVRALICGLAYAALWGLYALGIQLVYDGESLEMYSLLFVAPVFVAIGGGIAFATLDLDYGSGLMHYAFYLVTTIILQMIMGLQLIKPGG